MSIDRLKQESNGVRSQAEVWLGTDFVRGEIAPNCGAAATLKTDDSKVKFTGLTQTLGQL